MIHFKDKNNAVFAYAKSDLLQVDRATELEVLINDIEPSYVNAKHEVQSKLAELELSREAINVLLKKNEELQEVSHEVDGEVVEIEDRELNAEIEKATALVDSNTKNYDDALIVFDQIEMTYQPLKNEYNSILPIFFDIRERLKVLKKMTDKEVELYLNPPKSKDQHIVEAEIQKQLYAEYAEKNITILERKVRLGMATDDEKDLLTAWEIYSIKIVDIDTSLAPDIDWPQKP